MGLKMAEDRTRVYLARHGEVVNHGVYNGQQNVDITETGVRQMERLRELLKDKKLAAVYSSDLIRTQKGAEIIATAHGLVPQHFSQLREMHFGRWQGISYMEVIERYPEEFSKWIKNLDSFRIPEGESISDTRSRVVTKLQELVAKHRGEEIALVCHATVNRIILAEALGLPASQLLRMEQDYGCLNIIDYLPSWTVVKLLNG